MMSSDSQHMNEVAPPAIGGLLRLAWQIHRDGIYERIERFPNGRAQFSRRARRRPAPATARCAARATVNDLLGELERAGYVERHPHPEDRRARIVRLTAAGDKLQYTTHETSRRLEAGWAASVGAERMAALRSTLEEMIARGLPGESA